MLYRAVWRYFIRGNHDSSSITSTEYDENLPKSILVKDVRIPISLGIEPSTPPSPNISKYNEVLSAEANIDTSSRDDDSNVSLTQGNGFQRRQ